MLKFGTALALVASDAHAINFGGFRDYGSSSAGGFHDLQSMLDSLSGTSDQRFSNSSGFNV